MYSISNQEEEPIEKESTQSNIVLSEESEFIDCSKLDIKDISNNIKIISITKYFCNISPEKVSGGLFYNSFISYTVNTIPIGTTVKRRYNDFYWLRSTLINLFPGFVVVKLLRSRR